MISSFTEGKTVNELVKEFNFSRLTIVRNLKKYLGEEKYKKIISRNKKLNPKATSFELKNSLIHSKDFDKDNFDNLNLVNNSDELSTISQFTEIAPLDYDIENTLQKDLASVSLSDMEFPNVVYMIVDKKIELETKLLKDFPEWEFLHHDDLNRKTIEIFFDLNLAKRSCNKEQKVLKVPNTDVFRIASPVLIAKGISRIVCAENLIAL